MPELLAIIVPLSLAASISPTSYLLFFAILAGKENQLRNGLAFLVGGTAAYAGILAVVLATLGSPEAPAAPSHASLHGAIDFVLAAVALTLLVMILAKKGDSGPAKPKAQPAGLFAFVLSGASMKLLSANTLPPFIGAVREVAGASVSTAERATAYGVTLLVTMLPLLLPYVLFLFNRERTLALLGPAGAFLEKNKKPILATILGLVTLFLAYHGFIHLRAA